MQQKNITSYASLKPGKKRVTLLPGDGIGKEISDSVVGIFQAAGTEKANPHKHISHLLFATNRRSY
jgi:isocitrate/isopropylmalate dehydrogenase